jgi:hypothetical protein
MYLSTPFKSCLNILSILLKALRRKCGNASLMSFVSDTIGIELDFAREYKSRSLRQGVSCLSEGGKGLKGEVFSCRLQDSGCGVETLRWQGCEGMWKAALENGVHEYRWQVRVVLGDQPSSCTRLIYYPSSSAAGIGFAEGPVEGANRKLY